MSNIIKPLAQIFKIPESYQDGVFVTKIELFFSRVPIESENAPPVFFDIRTVENGFPSSDVFPNSKVTLSRDQVQGPTNGVINATQFELSRPIFLTSGKEYCFTISSHSSEYFCQGAKSEQNNLDRNNPEISTSQPAFITSDRSFLFDPSNSNTYTPNFETGSKALRYKIYIAKFDTSATGKAYFTEPFAQLKKLRSNPLRIVNGSDIIRVLFLNHGLKNNNKIVIDGIVGDSTDGNTLAGIPITEINNEHEITKVSDDEFTIQVATAATESVLATGGNKIVCTFRLPYDTFEIHSDFINFKQTNVLFKNKFRNYDDNALIGSFKSLKINENQKVEKTRVLNLNKILPENKNEVPPSFILESELKTNVSNLSPVIDVDRFSFVGVNNRNNTKYLTKEIELNDAAQQLRVFFSANRPVGTEIKAYYKILLDSEVDRVLLREKQFEEVTPLDIPINNNEEIFNEISFHLTEEDLEIDPTEEEGYVKVVVKLEFIFNTANFSKVPKIRNLRIISST
jgi:hypothetical protein